MKYSFVVPTKDNPKEAKKLLASIKEQKVKDYEIVIVDASKDNRIKKLSNIYKTRYIKERPLKGPSFARNLGWKAAKGEWVIWIDADHYLDKNFLLEIENVIKKDRKVNCIAPEHFYTPHNFLQNIITAELHSVRAINKLKFPTVLKKEAIKAVGGFDESLIFGEDRDLTFRIKKKYEIKYAPRVIEYINLVEDFSSFIKQSKWYGKSLLNFLRKNFSITILGNILYHAFMIPLIILSFFLYNSLTIVLITILFLESLFFAFQSKSIYGLFVPFIKIIRSTIEVFSWIV